MNHRIKSGMPADIVNVIGINPTEIRRCKISDEHIDFAGFVDDITTCSVDSEVAVIVE